MNEKWAGLFDDFLKKVIAPRVVEMQNVIPNLFRNLKQIKLDAELPKGTLPCNFRYAQKQEELQVQHDECTLLRIVKTNFKS